MSERDPLHWPSAGEPPDGEDSIAGQLASRIEALPAAPDDAMDWASIAAGFEREAAALLPSPEAAQLLFEAGRIYEERLGDPAGALGFHRQAFELDPTFLPNLRACRRLAMDAGDDELAAEAVEAEATAAPDAASRANLQLLRGRLLAGLGRETEAREALAGAMAEPAGGFAAAEEAARAAASAEDREALADAYVRCARTAADRRLSAHYLSAAAALFEEALGRPDRAGALALDAFALMPDDPLLRGMARRHAERLGRTDVLARILEAEAAASEGTAAAEPFQALARLEERIGRPEAAVAALERARAAAPADPLVLAELARLRETVGAFADASEALEALARAHLARRDPGQLAEAIAAKLRRVEIEEAELGRTHVAVQCCHEVLALQPGNRAALSALGRLCARLGDWDGLLAAFEAEADAARDPRERAQRTFKAALVLEERLGRLDDALARYRQALELDPDLLPARSALERLCESEGRWEDLCALLEADLGEMRSPSERVAHLFRIARIREERVQDLAGAARIYRRILEIEPDSRVALPAIASVLARLGLFDELAAVLTREAALADDPRRKVAVLQRRAELVEDCAGDPEAARAAWEDVRAAAPAHLPALRSLGRLHASAGRWEDLAAMFRAEAEATEDPVAAADLVHRVGEILERHLGRSDDACAAYQEVLTLAPDHLAALHALSRLYRARGDGERLVGILRAQASARTGTAERAAALCEAGRVAEERLEDAQRAMESYEEALRVAPGFTPAVRALDRLYAEAGREDALAALRRAEGTEPDPAARAERLLRLARLEADRVGDRQAALRATEELLALAPGHPAALLLELRLATDAERRARARAALAEAAGEAEPRVALLLAAALDLRALPRREALARAAALAPGNAALTPEEERRLRLLGDDGAVARFCEARRGEARDAPSRACWSIRAGEAWDRAGEADKALAAFRAALGEAPASLPALRGARALFARRGDWAAVRGTLQAEGAALQDPNGAAAAWLEAGTIAERRFGDPEAASADYRMAAARAPLDPEPLARVEALSRSTGAPQVAALHEARARAEGNGPRAAESWLAAARAALDTGGERDTALAALDRALQVDAHLPGALELRSRLLAESGRPAEALADCEACLALGGEPEARLLLHLSAAAISDEGLGDPARALPHLQAALAILPESTEALARLARVCAAMGRPAEALSALRRVVDAPGLGPEATIEYLLALADGEERLGTRQDALAACRRALALDPGHETALRLLVRLEERAGDPRRHLAALETVAAHARDPALCADAHVEAARLLGDAPGNRSRAIQHLRAALSLEPERDAARSVLAGHLEDAAPHDAVEEHRRLVARDPLRTESWAALYRLFARARAHDRAYVTATVLRWLGAPAPDAAAEKLLLEGDRQALPTPRALPDGEWKLLRAPGDRGPFGDVVAVAGDAIAAAIGDAPAARGSPLPADDAFRRMLSELAGEWAAPELELYPGATGRIDVEPGAPWAVLVGSDIARKTTTTAREQRFLLGRVMMRLRSRSCLAQILPAPALARWVAAAVRSVVPAHPGEDVLARRLAKAMSRRARRALERPARALAKGVATNVDGWAAAAAATADRAGLVLCGDVPTALHAILRTAAGEPVEGPAAAAAARTRPDALALLVFAASEEHFALRQRLRLAIA